MHGGCAGHGHFVRSAMMQATAALKQAGARSVFGGILGWQRKYLCF